MKKVFILIVLIIGIGAVQKYWPQVKFWSAQAPKLANFIQNQPAVSALKQQVLTGGALRGTDDSPSAFLTRSGTINFTNQARQKNGNLQALKENLKLDQAAQSKLQDMFARQYFEHQSPDGKGPADLAKAAGYSYVVIGENLALGNFKDDQALVTAWMNSPGHRANILNVKYEEIGVAVGKGMFEGKTTWLAVQEFGKPLSSCPQVDSNLKQQLDSLKGDVDMILPQLDTLKKQIDSTSNPQSQAEADAYNKIVADYNALVKNYNNKVDLLKQITATYNDMVQKFNLCAS